VPQVAGANTRHHPCSMLWSTVLIHVHFSCEVRHDALVLESDGKIVPLWIETAVGCMVSTLVRGSGPFRVRVARGAESRESVRVSIIIRVREHGGCVYLEFRGAGVGAACSSSKVIRTCEHRLHVNFSRHRIL